ncbi:outer membrane protein assembly factor BamB [Salinicola aestuarinus]|uniref:outer membrane protein assembly factor BamB n=1 Tax=Salinicola aestuarinus TaxID=1949082 RepID=UPI000DA1B160|nr:outer membrane protein assembly factor BamB [Salinicola aestuarinus]
MKLHRLLLPVGLTATLLAGCAGSVEPQYPPKDLTDFDTQVDLDARWSDGIGEGLGRARYPLTPLVDSGTLYAVDQTGELRALNTDSGETEWQVELGTAISSGIGADGGRLYIGTRNGEVLAIDRDDGNIEWRSRVSSEVLAPPQVNSSQVIVQSVDGAVTALNRLNGSEQWVYSSSQPALTLRGTGSPRVIDQVSFAGFANGRLVTLDNRSGQPLWDMRVAVPKGRTEVDQLVDIDGQPVLTQDGRLYVTSYNGRLLALEATSGEVIWEREESSYLTPLVVGNYLFTVNEASHVIAVEADTGRVMWDADTLEGRELTAPAFVDGNIAVGDSEGYLHLLDAASGEMRGRTHVDGSGLSLPLLTGNQRLYALANDGRLVAYDLENVAAR